MDLFVEMPGLYIVLAVVMAIVVGRAGTVIKQNLKNPNA